MIFLNIDNLVRGAAIYSPENKLMQDMSLLKFIHLNNIKRITNKKQHFSKPTQKKLKQKEKK